MAASIREVAKLAGVTHGTVSKVLGGNPKYVIPQATRERILHAVDELGYRPHFVAQSLKRGRTGVYGFYGGNRQYEIPNIFIAHILDGLRNGCNDCEKDLLLVGAFRGTDPDKIYGSLADGKIDGLIVFVYNDDPLCPLLVKSNMPMVAVVDPVENIPSVTLDEETGAKLIAKHLVEKGHRNIAYCHTYGPMRSAIDRHAAFVREARALGLAVIEFQDSFEAGDTYTEVDAIIRRPQAGRPTAVVCWNDGAATRLISQCQKLGVRVPEELAVVGFDGLGSTVPFTQRLTTVAAPWNRVARDAVHILDRQIAGQSVPAVTRLPVEFLPGTTS